MSSWSNQPHRFICNMDANVIISFKSVESSQLKFHIQLIITGFHNNRITDCYNIEGVIKCHRKSGGWSKWRWANVMSCFRPNQQCISKWSHLDFIVRIFSESSTHTKLSPSVCISFNRFFGRGKIVSNAMLKRNNLCRCGLFVHFALMSHIRNWCGSRKMCAQFTKCEC